jgi:hypothetical protein
MPLRNKKNNKKSGTLALIVIVVLLAIGGGSFAYIHHNDRTTAVTASAYTKGVVSNSARPNQAKSSQSAPSTATGSVDGSTTTGSQTVSAAALTAPSGDFVSDHHPNLSGSPAPNSMTSVCSTTPGATCQISFMQGNTIVSLSKKVADAGGGAYWKYTLQSIGLTSGSWTIIATATLDGQIKSASDVMDLVVSQ